MKLRTAHHPPAGKINVTPLIDVVMVLIIFYLIVGKLASDKRAKVDLPVSAVGVVDDTTKPLVITVVSVGSRADVLVDGVSVQNSELVAVLKGRGVASNSQPVMLRADRTLEYSRISPVINACREAGLASVKLVTDRRETGS